MPAEIILTPEPVTAVVGGTSYAVYQSLTDSLDVGAYDLIDLEVVLVSAASGYDTTIGLMTGSQMETEGGWIYGSSLVMSFDFPTITGAGSAFKRFDAGLLRYVRWIVAGSNAPGGSAVTFYIRGMGRSFR